MADPADDQARSDLPTDQERLASRRWLTPALVVGGLAVAGVAVVIALLAGRGDDAPAADAPTELAAPSTIPAPAGGAPRSSLADLDVQALVVAPAQGDARSVGCVLVASTAEARAQGLMGVTDLGDHVGMAFEYEEDVANAFHMLDTVMPLSIAWIDEAGAVVSTADMAPCAERQGCPTYAPDGPYRLALEVPQGDLTALGITAGATVSLGDPCPPP